MTQELIMTKLTYVRLQSRLYDRRALIRLATTLTIPELRALHGSF